MEYEFFVPILMSPSLRGSGLKLESCKMPLLPLVWSPSLRGSGLKSCYLDNGDYAE